MRVLEIDGVAYRTRDLCAYDQFHLLRAVQPVLPMMLALDLSAARVDASMMAGALAGVEADAVSQAFAAFASAAEQEREQGWQPATKAMALPDMLVLALAVVDENFSAYLSRVRPEFRAAHGRKQEFDPVFMPDGESWLFRPCECDPPLIEFLALYDGRAKIEHVAKANDLLDVRAENDYRAVKAAERERG